MEGNPGAGDAGNGQQAAQHVLEVPRPGQPGGVYRIHQQAAPQNGQNFTTNNENFVPATATEHHPQVVHHVSPQVSHQVIQQPPEATCADGDIIYTEQLQNVVMKYAEGTAKRRTTPIAKGSKSKQQSSKAPTTPATPMLDFTQSVGHTTPSKSYARPIQHQSNNIVHSSKVVSFNEQDKAPQHHEKNPKSHINRNTQSTYWNADDLNENMKTNECNKQAYDQECRENQMIVDLRNQNYINDTLQHRSEYMNQYEHNETRNASELEIEPNYVNIAMLYYVEKIQCINCKDMGTLSASKTTSKGMRCMKCKNINQEDWISSQLRGFLGDEWKKEVLNKDKLEKNNQRILYVPNTQTPTAPNPENTTRANQHDPLSNNIIGQLITKINDLQEVIQQNSDELVAIKVQYRELKTELGEARKTITSLRNIIDRRNESGSAEGKSKFKANDEEKQEHMQSKEQSLLQMRDIIKQTDKDAAVINMKQSQERGPTVKRSNTEVRTWADVVAQNMKLRNFPDHLRTKAMSMRKMLLDNKCITVEKPNITPLYFKNIRRCRIGVLRAALRQSLPSWAVIGLSFVGGSILELLCDSKLEKRVIHMMKVVNIRQVTGFNILTDGVKKETEKDQSHKRNVEAAKKRFERCIETSRSEYAKEWYAQQVQKCKEILDKNQEETKRIERSENDKSIKDKGDWIVVKQIKRKQVALYNDITIPKKATIPTDLTPMEISDHNEQKDEKQDEQREEIKDEEEQSNDEMEEEEEDWLLEEEHGDGSPSVSEDGEQIEIQEIQPIDEDHTGKSATEIRGRSVSI